MSETPKPTDTSDLSPFLADEEVEYARLLALAHAGGEAVMREDIARRGVEGMKRLAASLAGATMRAEAAERALTDIVIMLTDIASDDQLRALHDFLRGWKAT